MTYVPNPAAEAKLRAAVQEGVNAYLLVVSRTMRVELSKPGGGRLYRIGKGKSGARNAREAGVHRASRPGQPPAADTGMLRRSWQVGAEQLQGPKSGLAGIGSFFGGVFKSARRKLFGPPVKTASVVSLNTKELIGYRYGSAVKYARIDRGYGNVKSRPYIRPTLNNVRDLFQPTMQRALQRATRGA